MQSTALGGEKIPIYEKLLKNIQNDKITTVNQINEFVRSQEGSSQAKVDTTNIEDGSMVNDLLTMDI